MSKWAYLTLGFLLLLATGSAHARFVSVDPVQADANNGQNFNRYHYANNNPYKFTDPDGRQSREFNWENQNVHKITPPPQSDKDWLGPAIGYSLGGMLAAPVAGLAVANPVTATAVGNGLADIAMGDALGGASIAVGATAITVTADKISEALSGSNMLTTQRAVSLPVVQRYVDTLLGGSKAPAIKVADGVIVDGNHRYAAGRIAGQEPSVQPGILAPGQASQVRPIQEIKVDPKDWDK